MLCPDAASLGRAAALTATTARRHTTIAGTVHPSSRSTGNGAERVAACARHRAGPLVSHALVPVSARNEEHGGTIGDSTNNGTASNNSTGRVDLAAGANVASHGTTIARSISRRGFGIRGGIDRSALAGKLASSERAGCVDHASQVIDRRVLVVPELISRVAKLSCKLSLQVLRNGEHGQSGDESRILHCVERLQSKVLNLGLGNVQTISDGDW